MALKIELKPKERIIIGSSVITNDGQSRTKLKIEGDAAILREPDILRSEDAKTPCEKIYLVVQMMYLSPDPAEFHDHFFELIKDVVVAAPSTTSYIERLSNQILTGSYYKALKETKALIKYEKELMQNA
ncbi:MAG: flagellar biosynthesis repressor FlbT [Pseudomonadota bacterium]